MSNKGGYQIIDLQRIHFVGGGNSETIPGIYNIITGTKKPFLITGIIIDDEEYDDIFATMSFKNGDIHFIIYNYTFYVETDDSVSVE